MKQMVYMEHETEDRLEPKLRKSFYKKKSYLEKLLRMTSKSQIQILVKKISIFNY